MNGYFEHIMTIFQQTVVFRDFRFHDIRSSDNTASGIETKMFFF